MANNNEITSEYLEKIARPYETPIFDPWLFLDEVIKECKTEKEENKDGK